jgi:predicted Zn-dependent protease
MNQEHEETTISLSLDDFRHVTAAEGYIELEMYTEADAELEQVDPLCQVLSPVLALKLCVYAGLGKWATMETVARKMAQHFPHDVQWRIWWASAARQLQSIESAKRILLDGLETHPNDPTIHYNLSCYESRLHHFRQAQRHLARAIQLDARFQLIALKDQDLKPLWQELAQSPLSAVLDAGF